MAVKSSAMTVKFLDDTGPCVAILQMQKGENRMDPEFVELFNACLDKVDSNPSCKGLVTTGEGKFFSNGFNMDWLRREEGPELINKFDLLLARILTFPIPTVAAINGHCYAGGAMLALAHDCRVMNAHRGWICLNEVHHNLPISPLCMNLLKAKLKPGTAVFRVIALGQRFTAPEALEPGLVDKAVSPTTLERECCRLVRTWADKAGYTRETMVNMKRHLYADVLKHLHSSRL